MQIEGRAFSRKNLNEYIGILPSSPHAILSSTYPNLLKDGKDRDRVHGGDEGGEEEGLKDTGGVMVTIETCLTHSP